MLIERSRYCSSTGSQRSSSPCLISTSCSRLILLCRKRPPFCVNVRYVCPEPVWETIRPLLQNGAKIARFPYLLRLEEQTLQVLRLQVPLLRDQRQDRLAVSQLSDADVPKVCIVQPGPSDRGQCVKTLSAKRKRRSLF